MSEVLHVRGTFCGRVSGAWAYLSCVFYVVSDVRCSHRACPTVLSVLIVATSPVAELLRRLHYILGGENDKKKKKTLPCSQGWYLKPHFCNNSTFHWSWCVPSCIGDAFNRWCHISWICIERVTVVFPFLSIHLFPAVGWCVVGRTRTRQRASPVNPRVEDLKDKNKDGVNCDGLFPHFVVFTWV